jgi:hypothetical protein
MRKSTKLITVAAALGFVAIGAGSAFTASNTVPASVAGFGEGLVTGATVTAVHYVQNAADPMKLDSVSFDSSTDLTATTVTMTLKDGSLVIMGSPYACTYTAYAAGATTITCLTADNPLISDLGATDLTVSTT